MAVDSELWYDYHTNSFDPESPTPSGFGPDDYTPAGYGSEDPTPDGCGADDYPSISNLW